MSEWQQTGSHTGRLASHAKETWDASNKTKLTEAIREIGVIATVRVPNKHQLPQVASALLEGGIRVLDLAYTTIRSGGSPIQELKESGLLIGIGAVTRSAQAREARAFGADFITASVTTPDVVLACEEMKIPCILSGLTPTENWRAHEIGADFVKITAAEALGGPSYIRSLHESLAALRLVGSDMPLDGYIPYLDAGVEVLEFQSSLGLPRLVEDEAWAEISRRAAKIVRTRENWKAKIG